MASFSGKIDSSHDEKSNNELLKECKHCKMAINTAANVCHHCGKNQNYIWFYLDKFSIVGSIILVLLAYMQYFEARQKNIQATEALNEAKDAKIKVSELNEIIVKSQNNLEMLKTNAENALREASDAKIMVEKLDKMIVTSQENLDILKINAEKAANDVNDAKLRIAELDEIIIESKENLDSLEKNVDFMEVLLAAQNDNWDAYEKLHEWAKDTSHPLYKVALNATIEIRTDYGGPISHGHLNISWNNGTDPNTLSFERLKQIYAILEPELHADLVETIWKRDDFQKKDKMSFFIEVLRTSKSITAKHDAAKYFVKCSNDNNLEWRPFNIEALTDWWDQNKSNVQ